MTVSGFSFLKIRSRFATQGSGKWRFGGDEGQVTILLIGFVVVALALIAVVVSAAQVHLERTRLAALADLAALAAAEQVSDEAYFAPTAAACTTAGPAGGPGAGAAPAAGCVPGAALAPSDDEVAAAVGAYLTDYPDSSARWTDLQVVEADSPDGRTVRVTLGAVVRPAWVAWVLEPFTDGIEIGATSAARAW
jgi:uncharacterized membrane protein